MKKKKSMLNILVVEDDVDICEQFLIFFKFIKTVETKVCIVNNGNDAITKFKTKFYDIVILDLKIPCIGGEELLKIFKHIEPSAHVIIVSGADETKVKKNLINNGATEFISKPFDLMDLKTIIENIQLYNNQKINIMNKFKNCDLKNKYENCVLKQFKNLSEEDFSKYLDSLKKYDIYLILKSYIKCLNCNVN